VTGVGDLTSLNIPKGDPGGELDPHVCLALLTQAPNTLTKLARDIYLFDGDAFWFPQGYDGNGNPIGGLVFGTAFNGTLRQYHEWTNFMGANFFCFRACLDGPEAPKYCQHVCLQVHLFSV